MIFNCVQVDYIKIYTFLSSLKINKKKDWKCFKAEPKRKVNTDDIVFWKIKYGTLKKFFLFFIYLKKKKLYSRTVAKLLNLFDI